jgi:uncharacterized protein
MKPAPIREVRSLTAPIELNAEDSGPRLVGYASRFNDPFQPYSDWPEFLEVVHPGAFNRTLRERPDVLALRNHDPDKILGRTGAGTLRLNVDALGLGFEVDLNTETTVGRDTESDVRRGDIPGCSIGFVCVVDEVVSNRETGIITRTLLDVELFEITPACTFPANPSTSVSLRSAIEARALAASARPNNELIRLIRRRSGR